MTITANVQAILSQGILNFDKTLQDLGELGEQFKTMGN